LKIVDSKGSASGSFGGKVPAKILALQHSNKYLNEE
jgi:hypothetical protein